MITRSDLLMVVVLAEAGRAILGSGDQGAVARVRAELVGAAPPDIADVVWRRASSAKRKAGG